MAKSRPINIQVSDIIQWFKRKELKINETFQRHAVWSPQAKTFLIDTILHELPIPKIYLRTILDSKRQTSIREIVDGQQRVRAIVEFADNKFKLTKRSEDYFGYSYEDLNDESKAAFLGYIITAEQLINATDDDVIDIFGRLNSYTVTLNAAEKRHAEFQTEFKFAIRRASQAYRNFIEKHNVFTLTQRFRMADDELFAEIYGVLLQGITDGGAPKILKLYKYQDDSIFTEEVDKRIRKKIDFALNFIDNCFSDGSLGMFSKHYHLLIMVAAILHHKYGIPVGQIESMPPKKTLASRNKVLEGLSALERSFEQKDASDKYEQFIKASSASTQRIASRRIRFAMMAEIFGA